ncbi:MAG: hypothetical protein P8M32_08345, partial [Phycisphaerales bacterium]|nr:hypothetical protein [Phycisphaerales bacterium]
MAWLSSEASNAGADCNQWRFAAVISGIEYQRRHIAISVLHEHIVKFTQGHVDIILRQHHRW